MNVLRFEDWTNPVRTAEREVLVAGAGNEQNILFVPGLGAGAWVFAEHWLAHAAGRGFAAHALTPRAGGDLRAHVHDVVQAAAALPTQTVLVGHGVGALIVARALGRYPAKAAALVSPVLDGWQALGAALRANPLGTLPALVGGRLRLNRGQLFSAALPVAEGDRFAGRRTGKPKFELLTAGPAAEPVGKPPVLVVGSPDDRIVPRKSLDKAAARYGGAPLLFPGMGHDLMLDAGWQEPIDAILDWLTKELSAAA